ncbi:MAG: hypothetical protein ACOYJ2_00770 [Rickettsiales bacterium]
MTAHDELQPLAQATVNTAVDIASEALTNAGINDIAARTTILGDTIARTAALVVSKDHTCLV